MYSQVRRDIQCDIKLPTLGERAYFLTMRTELKRRLITGQIKVSYRATAVGVKTCHKLTPYFLTACANLPFSSVVVRELFSKRMTSWEPVG